MGRIKVEGMTSREISDSISSYLINNGVINDPIVNVRFQNFKVSVLGEVTSPKTIKVDSERFTIIDALAQSGDMSIFGKRKNIKLIRETEGKREVVDLDITDPELMNTPYYYLQQNDMVYVEPNKSKVFQGKISTFWSPVISVVSLLTTIGLYFAR